MIGRFKLKFIGIIFSLVFIFGLILLPIGFSKIAFADTGLNFNGTSTYVNLGGGVPFDAPSRMTLETWVKLNDNTNFQGIVSKEQSGGYGLDVDTSGLFKISAYINGAYVSARSNSVPSTGVWYHITGVYNGSKILLYINGTLQNDQPSASGTIGSDSTTPLTVGDNPDPVPTKSVEYLNGSVSEIRLWNIALSQTQINSYANQTLTGNENGLWGDWILNSTGTIVDKAGTQNGSASGFPSDKTPPTAPSISATTGWQNPSASVSIADGTDSGVGVRETDYKINSGSWVVYNNPITISTNGTTTVYARSIDNDGNISSTVSKTVSIDSADPSLPTINAPSGWQKSNISVTLTGGSDSQSGVKETDYQINGGSWTKYSSAFTISSQGSTTIGARTVDNVGNITSTVKKTVQLDTVAPSVTVTPSTTATAHDDVIISLSSSDSTSGVKQIQNPSGTWVTGTSLTYNAVTNGTYSFTVQDNAGNQTVKSISVSNIGDRLWFNTPPSGSISFSGATITGNQQVFYGKGLLFSLQNNQTSNWKLTLSATPLTDSTTGHMLPTGSLQVKAPTISTTNPLPLTFSGYQTIDNSNSNQVVYTNGNADGTFGINMTDPSEFKINLPANAYKGSYTTTLTYQLVTGP